MPFTPFHFGPGAVLKAAIPRHFSFSVFCFAQVATDIEVLAYMARGTDQLHGYFHTYVGAAGIGLFSVVVGRPVCRRFLRWWSSQPQVPLKEYYGGSAEISFTQAVGGAFIGSLSHVFLDSIMHRDIRPFLPFNNSNSIFGVIGPGALHLVCFLLAVVGTLICARIPKSKL